MKNIFLSALLLIFIGCSDAKNKKPELYDAGFKTIQTVDKSRIYKPDTDSNNYLHYRPLDIDIWYPSKVYGTDSVLLFRDILVLLEKRANYYTASNAADGITAQIAQSFCDGFKCSDSTKLLNYKTKSFRNVPFIERTFPLVIYMCAFNGMGFENFGLFEELTRKGFVVVSINSIGGYPGDMTMKKEDLLEQVNDAIASLKAIGHNQNIDFSRIGIIGYSWGGLSGALLAGKISDVSCLISLDGSEFHPYGESKDEDKDFDDIRFSQEFVNMRISVPYLRLESTPLAEPVKIDSIYNFSEKLSGEKLIFKIDSAKHEDFSCLSEVVRVSGDCKINNHFRVISKLTLSFLETCLKNKNTFSQTIDQELKKIVIIK